MARITNTTIQIFDALKIHVFLTVRLNTYNLERAIETANPFGINVGSGVRAKGIVHEHNLEKFMTIVLGRR